MGTEKLRELLANATPGPWQSMNEYQWDSIIGDIDGPDDGDMHYESVADITSHHDRSRANAALIVAAVNAIPALLSERDRLQHERDKFMWQVRDTCVRAEKAESQAAELRARCEALESLGVELEALAAQWRSYGPLDQYTLGLEAAADELDALLAEPSAQGVDRG